MRRAGGATIVCDAPAPTRSRKVVVAATLGGPGFVTVSVTVTV